jgi:hypothetical protein
MNDILQDFLSNFTVIDNTDVFILYEEQIIFLFSKGPF